jgi:hypothetical protein
MLIFSVQIRFSHNWQSFGFFSYDFFIEGVEEVFEDDALTLQESIGSILASLACLEGDQLTVETTALLFFLLKTYFASSAKFAES